MILKREKETGAIKWMLRVAHKQIPSIVILAVVTALQSTIGVFYALISKYIVNAAVGHDYNILVKSCILLVLLILIYILMRLVIIYLQETVVARLEIVFKTHMFEQIIKKDYAKISSYHSGDLMNRLTGDVNVVANGTTTLVPAVASLVARLVSAIIILIALEPRMGFLFLFGGITIFAVSRFFKKYVKRFHKEIQKTEGETRSFFQEAIENLLVVKVFVSEDKMMNRADELQERNYKVKVKRRRLGLFTSTGMTAIFQFTYLLALAWGAFGIYNGTLDYGTLTALTQLVSQVQAPLAGFSNIISRYYTITASCERLLEVVNIEDEKSRGESMTADEVTKTYSMLESIKFDDICFSYGRNAVLEHASFTMNKGDFTAIMGISGIGKSTLMKLLLGVYNGYGGSISINLTDGRAIPADYKTRSLFCYVPQGNMLLSGTIRENITFLRENASEDEINEAIRISCADEFISELPEGLETVIGEKGHGLSEGQVQRIAIARAILTKSPIILLDEATSALDEATESKFLKNLKALNNMTCIIISHKKAALDICNRHIQISDKRIVESSAKSKIKNKGE